MKLSELLSVAPGARAAGSAEIEVRGLSCDSRALVPGDLFFALPGAKTDGNRFAKAACAAGAAAVVSELEPPPIPATLPAVWVQVPDALAAMGRMADLYFGRPSAALCVIGVTGTNGKTTTTYLLESIVSAAGGKAGVAGTVDYRLGGKVLSCAPNTTPVSLELQRLLAAFRDGGASHAVMEVSSHALALKRVEEVDFDCAVFTNLSRDHLDFHKDDEAYFEAKARLFDLLGKTASSKKRRVAVINHDDPRHAALARRAAGVETISYGLSSAAPFRAENVATGLEGSTFDILWRSRRLRARTALVGGYNVSNALAAAAAGLGLGLPEEAVLRGLADLRLVPGRLEPVSEGQPFRVFVDYAHTPDALEKVLGILGALPHGRLITVFGCGGERDPGKRAPMGRAAGDLSDVVVLTSDNPRGEDPAAILAQVAAGLDTSGRKNYKIVPDRGEAIAEAVRQARPGDIVLLAGKGHENHQILKDRTIPFDDRQAARDALRGGRRA